MRRYRHGAALLTVVLFSLVFPALASAWDDGGSCMVCFCLYISDGECCPSCSKAQDGEMGTTGCRGGACGTVECNTWGTFCSEILVIP
jgi:hypothetical protein